MNWTILKGLADSNAEFQDYLVFLHAAISRGSGRNAKMWAMAAAHIAFELMDRADDLDELERQAYDDERIGE